MTSFQSFGALAASWQNFYMLVGAASATLAGLIFVAVTFGADLVKPENVASARAFLDPTLSHYVQVLTTSCLLVIPNLDRRLLAVLLLAIGVLRLSALVRIFRHMRVAQRTHNDLELSDWLMGIALPLVCYATLLASAIGFYLGYALAFSALAAVTLVTLLNGIFGAWEMIVWLALTRSKRG